MLVQIRPSGDRVTGGPRCTLGPTLPSRWGRAARRHKMLINSLADLSARPRPSGPARPPEPAGASAPGLPRCRLPAGLSPQLWTIPTWAPFVQKPACRFPAGSWVSPGRLLVPLRVSAREGDH